MEASLGHVEKLVHEARCPAEFRPLFLLPDQPQSL